MPSSEEQCDRALLREAEADLISRLIPGIPPYLVLLAILAATTSYRLDHPALFWGFAGTIFLSTAIRIALKRMGPRAHELNQRFRSLIFVVAIGLPASAAGIVHASSVWYGGYESWPFVITMLWIVGCSSGSTISFTPNFRFLVLYLSASWSPVFAVDLVVGGKQGYTVAIATVALWLFLVTQGRLLSRAYWRHLRARALEAARTAELQAAKAAAETASNAKGQFLANMSHEIRTPMHGVLGMARLALTARSEAETRDYLETLCGTAEGLLRLINDILDFSKSEAGKMTLEQVPFSVQRLLEEVRLVMAPQAAAKGLDLRCRTAGEVPDYVVADPARLRQVLINLVGNAVKFTSAGSVQVEAALEADSVLRFRVRDTGIGIPAAQHETIFEAFGQADASVTRRFGGTGLGLAICSQLVRLMGGRIAVDSAPGAGSTFDFTCPVKTAAAPSPGEPHEEPSVPLRPLQILVAEDNAVNQKVALTFLQQRGHQVTLASNGREAIDAWEARPFDVILTDNQMPVMGGLEAVRYIREREETTGRRRTPVIALTASAMIGDRERFLKAGMDGFLAKPFSVAELDAVLRETLA